MCLAQPLQVPFDWQGGGRSAIVTRLNELSQCCIATGIPNGTVEANFISVGFPNGAPERCDNLLAVKDNGTVYMSVVFSGMSASWFVLYDPFAVAGFSAGMMMQWGASAAPSGWLMCDGDIVSRATYGNLFAIIGETYGAGDGVTTFALPDFRARSPMGVNNAGLPNGVDGALTTLDNGDEVGEEEHTLTVAELAEHDHSLSTYNEEAVGTNVPDYMPSDLTTPFALTPDTGLTGSDTPHNTVHPVLVTYMIIKF